MAILEVIVKKLLLALLVLVFLSCGSEESSSTAGEENIVAEHSAASGANLNVDASKQAETGGEMADDPEEEIIPVASLELCYATSINMPEELYGPDNVFDDDPATCWATMPGAAPDEGLYFSFEEPIYIDAINVKTVTGNSAYEEIEFVVLYVNGVEGGAWRPRDRPIPINSTVNSIFLKIEQTESMSWDAQGIRYRKDLPVGISEISILVNDKDDNLEPIQIVPLGQVGGFAEASSSLDPVESYCTDFLFDSRPAFGWADGNENNTGDGESLIIHFDEPQRIEKIRIWNGYHRSSEHFVQNERAEIISFAPYGEDPPVYELADTMDPQLLTLDYPLEASSFFLDFIEIYPGQTYRDLVISELQFFDGEEWFVIDSGESETRKLAILEWASGNDASRFLDKQIVRDYPEDYGYVENWQSLVIRSNGSFVLWKDDSRMDSRERMYADGNWQILDDNTIRIFGRLHRLAHYDQDTYDPYAGGWSDQDERLDRMTIFSDTLRFGEDWLSSSRGLFEDFSF